MKARKLTAIFQLKVSLRGIEPLIWRSIQLPEDTKLARLHRTVLVIDDEEVIRSYVKAALEQYGYTVLLAANGREGVRLFQERRTDIGLVLLDFGMPGLDGLATLQRIQAIRADIPVIVSTGFGDTDIEKRFAGKEVSAFFQKPYTARQLAGKVKERMPPAGAGD